jgi:hypothetical protein
MRISLRNWLLVVGVVGAVVGIMTRLLFREPETFLNVLQLGATVGSFLAAVGTIIWIGLRSAPRRRWLIVWGIALLLTPMLIALAVGLLMPSGNPLSLMSTQRLIAVRLSQQIDEPWVWQELERRLREGALTKVEVDDAIQQLTAHMKRTNPQGWNQPFSWQRRFLDPALQQNMISEPVFLDLCDAFFGTQPTVTLLPPALSDGDTRFNFRIEYGTPWSDTSGLGVKLVWDVKQLELDGKPVTVRRFQKHFGREAQVNAEAPLAAGDNQLVLELDCALIDESRLQGANLDTLKAPKWPQPRKRWTSKVTLPIPVAPVIDSRDPE